MSVTNQRLASSLHSSVSEITGKIEAFNPSANISYIVRQNNCNLAKKG